MKKLVLINPHPQDHFGEENISVLVQMPLNLGYLAALTPKDWEVEVIDECIEVAIDGDTGDFTFDTSDVKLVGITAVSYQAPRAYQIARACKKHNIPAVIGGPHASTIPDEVAANADAAVVGEAEGVWAELVRDVEKGQLKKQYLGGLTPLNKLKGVHPDRELLKKKYGYRYSSIITTRGCPNSCDFCAVPIFQGRKYRERPVEDVLAEMAATDYKGLMFAEDNFYGHSKVSNERARSLFKGMTERNIIKDWFGFTALNTTSDEECLKYMASSGCLGILIGIESLDEEVLKSMNKRVNIRMGVESYIKGIENLHRHGIICWGSVIFGTDGDKKDNFKRMTDFALEVGMDVLTFGIYTPMPMTASFDRMTKEGRIFRNNYPRDWYYYNSNHLVFGLKDMPLEDFIEGMEYVYENLYSREALRKRFDKTLRETNNSKNAMFAYRVNIDWRMVFKSVIDDLKILSDSGVYNGVKSRSKVAMT
ncbi:MAG: radical SAM protein [Candidatus Brocadiales bacterium]|nr:radical SAM protein [Candidatus Bathyanammoxibius amoris]